MKKTFLLLSGVLAAFVPMVFGAETRVGPLKSGANSADSMVVTAGGLTNLTGNYVQTNSATHAWSRIGTNGHALFVDNAGWTNGQFTNGQWFIKDPSGNYKAWASNGNFTISGTFSGSGASLTSLPAANLSGTQANGTESTNTALLNTAQTSTALKTFSGGINTAGDTNNGNFYVTNGIMTYFFSPTNLVVKSNGVTVLTVISNGNLSATKFTGSGANGMTVNSAGSVLVDNGGGNTSYQASTGFFAPNGGGIKGTANNDGATSVDWGLVRGTAKVVSVTDGSSSGGTLRFIATTPSQITGNQDNYNPGGTSHYLRLSTDASRNITGLTFSSAQVDGQTHIIVNVGSFDIVLKHLTTSTSGNQFQNTTGADITLTAGQEANCWYDGTTAKWRVSKRN